MSWNQALKEYATQKNQFIIPKKGTQEYEAVKAIQAQLSSSTTSEKASPSKKKTVVEIPVETKTKTKKKTLKNEIIPQEEVIIETPSKPKKSKEILTDIFNTIEVSSNVKKIGRK